MKAKLLIIVCLLLFLGCDNRHSTKKDVFLGDAKLVFYETASRALSGSDPLIVSNSVKIALAEVLCDGALLQTTTAESGTIIVNPNIEFWKKNLHISRSNEIALSIQWINIDNKPEYFSVNFDGLIKPISQKYYIDSVKIFGNQDALIIIR